MLGTFLLIHWVFVFVKDEGSNLGTMDIALCSIIDYEPLKLLQLYEGICFGHVMSKAYQYAMNDDKVSMSLTLVNVTNLPKLICIKQLLKIKKSKKRRHEWEKPCIENGM